MEYISSMLPGLPEPVKLSILPLKAVKQARNRLKPERGTALNATSKQ
jgi:hypothetical protein